MKTKICCRCGGDPQPLDNFTKKKSSKDGRNAACKGCTQTASHTHYNNNVDKYLIRNREANKRVRKKVREYKDKPCLDCNKRFHYSVMDFDHVRGKKVKDVGRLTSSNTSWKKVLLEINKCDLVCSNCHRIRTWNRAHPNEKI